MSDVENKKIETESIFTYYTNDNNDKTDNNDKNDSNEKSNENKNSKKDNANVNFKTCSYDLSKKDCSKDSYAVMRLLCHVAKNVYNSALYEVRLEYFKAIGKLDENGNKNPNYDKNSKITIPKKELYERLPLKITKLYNLLKVNRDDPSKENINVLLLNSYMCLCICREVIKNFKSFLKGNIKMPKYLPKKGYFNLTTNQIQYNVNMKVRLPLSLYFANKVTDEYKANNKLFDDDIINEFLEKYKDTGINRNIFLSVPKYIRERTEEYILRQSKLNENNQSIEKASDNAQKIESTNNTQNIIADGGNELVKEYTNIKEVVNDNTNEVKDNNEGDIEKKEEFNKEKGINIVELRIVPINDGESFKVEFVYEDDKADLEYKDKTSRVLSIDIGINNLATCVDSGNKYSFIIDGKVLKYRNHNFNKMLSRLYKYLSLDKRTDPKFYVVKKVKDKDGTEREVKYFRFNTKRMKRIRERRNNYMKSYMYKAAAYILKYAMNNNIDTIVMGYNKDFKLGGFNIKKGRTRRKLNQSFLQIPHAKFRDRLAEICARNGIKFVTINEAHTSKCSFYDNETIEHHDKYLGSRKKRGLYITAEKKQVNADVNGSLNIMKRYALEIQKQNEEALIKDDALIGEVESIRTTNIIIPVKVHLEIKKGNKISRMVK